jgi:hypothetical protein
MPIFGRRQIQQMLNELGPWLVPGKATDLLKRLENVDPDHALPAEFELALSWAVTKTARLEIDRTMGNRTTDIYSPDLLSSAPLAIDVAAISDVSLRSGTHAPSGKYHQSDLRPNAERRFHPSSLCLPRAEWVYPR